MRLRVRHSRPRPSIRPALRYGAAAVAALALVLPWEALAQPAEPADRAARQEREAEMFGEPEPAAEPVGDASKPTEGRPDEREQTLFGDPTAPEPSGQGHGVDEQSRGGSALEAAFADRLAESEDWLALGGQLYSRAEYYALRQGDYEDFTLTAPTLLDVYLDGRPNEDVRAFVRGRLSHNFTLGDDAMDARGNPLPRTSVLLDQLFFKTHLLDTLFVTAGRQPVRWGSGRFWNPTDFLHQQLRDPLAIFDERPGVGLVKLHLPIEAYGWNLYAVANLEEAGKPADVGLALRAELLFEQTEVALSFADRRHSPRQVGFDVSSGIGLFDLRFEVAASQGLKTIFYRGRFDLERFQLPEEYSREDEWIVQAVAGCEVAIRYSDQDNVMIGVEYFFNDAGYRTANKLPYLLYKQQYVPFRFGRHYGAMYILLLAPGTWNDTSFILSTLGNLSDGSYATRLDYEVLLHTHLRLNLYGTLHYGKNGELHFGYELEPIAGQEGVSIVQPLLDLGVSIRINL